MKRTHTYVGTMLVAGLLFAGCGKKTAAPAVDSTSTTVASNVTVVPAHDSLAYPKVLLKILSPKEGQVLANASDSVKILLHATGVKLGVRTPGDSTKGIAFSMEGQHVHVIVDDRPYMAMYKDGVPFNVGVLSTGLHTIRAFPSFDWHESIKTSGAFASRTFYVGKRPSSAHPLVENHLDSALLTYSRPKGTYKAGQPVLLDFYVTNATLGANTYKVAVWIDKKLVITIDQWQPYYINGLTVGQHTIHLQLLDSHGDAVPGSYNSPESTITIK